MSDVLSNEALEDLERKRQAATPGPWQVDAFDARSVVVCNKLDRQAVAEGAHETQGGASQIEANAAFIATTNPEAVGKLLTEVRAWRRLNEELKAQGIHLKNTPGEKT